MLRHPAYPKMATSALDADAATLGQTWVATEKVHGANLCLSSDGEALWASKRSGALGDDDDFFSWQRIRDRYGEAVRSLAAGTGGVLHVYGELCGGHYPHPQTPPAPVAPVQPGVRYAPDVEWLVFDIAQASGRDLNWWSFRRVRDAVAEVAICLVPILAEGDWPMINAVSESFPTRVPALLGFAALAEPGFAEGLVLRTLDLPRVVMKRKAPQFADIKDLPRPPAQDPVAVLEWELQRRVTLARLQGARSRSGPIEDAAIVADAVGDVWNEVLNGHCGQHLSRLPRDSQTSLWEALERAFRQLT